MIVFIKITSPICDLSMGLYESCCKILEYK